MLLESIEKEIMQIPIYQYATLPVGDIVFSEKVRAICEQECPMYSKSWSCPPAVGSVDDCKNRVRKYKYAFLFINVIEVTDLFDMDEMLATRKTHNQFVYELKSIFEKYYPDILTLSSDSCTYCDECTYPSSACSFSQMSMPCIESYGILVTDLAEKAGIDFFNGSNTVTWFGLIFFDVI